MKMFFKLSLAITTFASSLLLSSCGMVEEANNELSPADEWTFAKDLNFLDKYADCIVLGENKSFVAISPKLQGRVMTSSLDGDNGYSLGWFNKTLLMSGQQEQYLNIIGGEDRLWVGPEGSDVSVFFPQNELYLAQNWKIPLAFSKQAWELVARNKYQVKFQQNAELTNAKGQTLKLNIEREVSFISKANSAKILGIEIPDTVKTVAFQSINKITNKNDFAWSAENGILNMAVMSCFHANKSSFAFIPYKEGEQKDLGAIVTDPYNEPVGDRLSISPELIRLRTDGAKLGEIYVNAKRSKNVIISYDSQRNILTFITYLSPKNEKKYLPAIWKRAGELFEGDAISVFNNGPAEKGSFFAEKFFESTSYSPALALMPEKSQLHIQRVFHFKGSEYELGIILHRYLGLTIKQLRP